MGFEQVLATVFALLIGITFHEFSHGFVANLLGDPTARLQGRLTLNPLKHLDPLGTIMIIYSGLAGIGFGWGKPTPVNPYNVRWGNRGLFLVAIAGPTSNFLIALILSLLIKSNIFFENAFMTQFLIAAMMLNIGLMIFNLLPFPPLDGSAIIGVLFPRTWKNYEKEFQKYGAILLLILLFFGRGVLSAILTPFFEFFLNLLT